MAEHAGSREVIKARPPRTCSRPCAFEEKKAEKKKNEKIRPNPNVMKHAPRVRPHSPASIDPGFVEIGLVQLSQSVKTTNVTHTLTD